MLTLITGGARSGKTSFALSLCGDVRPCTYIATAELLDDEMRDRARRHRHERGGRWATIEEPYSVAERVEGLMGVVVVDCLTIWLSNWMLRCASENPPSPSGKGQGEGLRIRRDLRPSPGASRVPLPEGEGHGYQDQIDALCSAFQSAAAHVIAITNEVGSSIVPDNPLARQFRDWSGLMNQRAAASAANVYLMVCGIPLRVK